MAENEVVIMIDSIINVSNDWLQHPESRPYPFNDIKLMSGAPYYGNLDPQAATEKLSRIDRIIELLQNQRKHGLANQIEKKVEKIKTKKMFADTLINTGSYRPSQCTRELEQATREFVGTLKHIKQMIRKKPEEAGLLRPVERKQKKQRKQTPSQFYKEARERKAASLLASNPNLTAKELGDKLECHKTTVIRLEAWKNKGVNNGKIPNGYVKTTDEDRTIEAIDDSE